MENKDKLLKKRKPKIVESKDDKKVQKKVK